MGGNPDGILSLAKYSRLPAERIRYVPDADVATVRSIRRGVLFLMAFWSGPAVQAFAKLTEVLARLGRGRSRADRRPHADAVGIILRDDGALVGYCGFFVRPVKGTTMGYAILPQYRGRGLATEAAAAVLDWAERHDVDVYASVRPPNRASVRVLAKIGMRLVDSYVDEDGQREIYRRQ